MVGVFVFGYLTCKVFYYFKSARLSIQLIQISNLVSLFLLTRALENFEYSRSLCLKDLRKKDISERNLKIYEENLDLEIETFKSRSISLLLEVHPDFFQGIAPYTDWKSAMNYLESNRNVIVGTYLVK
jgi:hypothetical protein